MSLFNEVVHAPDEEISFNKAVHDAFLGAHTGIGRDNPPVINAIRRDLTKDISNILSLLREEAEYAIKQELGDPPDWTAIHLYTKLLRIVAYLSGRVFVGLPLSREDEWLTLSISYTSDVSAVRREGSKWHYLLRPLVAPFLKSVRQTRTDLQKARKWMEPLVAEVLRKHGLQKRGNANAKAGSRGTFVSWLLQYLPAHERTAERIGMDQMLLSFASIHTTTMTSSMVLLDLASRPWYIHELRNELATVLREGGEAVDEKGRRYIPKSSFAKMHKLDSFIKESQRLNPIGFVGSTRVLLQDYTFANGLKLYKGTNIGFPMWGVYNSTDIEAFSPKLNRQVGNKGPEAFDGFRFARLRGTPGRENKHQAVTTGPDSLNFGHGLHACPGRFFAIYEIKTLVLEFIRHLDVRLKGDVDGQGGEDLRPKNVVDGLVNNPDFGAYLEIKKRDRKVL